MTIFFLLISGILIITAIISLFWTIIGVPAGIILFIVDYFKKTIKNKKEIFWCALEV